MAFRIAIPCLKLTAYRNLAKNRLSTIRHKVSTIEHTIVVGLELARASPSQNAVISEAMSLNFPSYHLEREYRRAAI